MGGRGCDGRFQAAQFRFGQIESPTISIEDVLNDGEPEACAVAALVKADAAFEYARPLGRRDSGAVIFDNNRCRGAGTDTDTLCRMACGILQQVAEHFGEVGAVERHLHIVGDVRLESHANDGRRER